MGRLLSDRTAKNLLYIETVAEVGSGSWEVSADMMDSLASLQRKGMKKEVKGKHNVNTHKILTLSALTKTPLKIITALKVCLHWRGNFCSRTQGLLIWKGTFYLIVHVTNMVQLPSWIMQYSMQICVAIPTVTV